MNTMLALLPIIAVIIICSTLIAIKRYDLFKSAKDHFAPNFTEIGIISSNISAATSMSLFWVLFIFCFKSWGVPSFISVLTGIVISYLAYFWLISDDTRCRSFINFIYRKNIHNFSVIMYLLIVVTLLLVELIFLRLFLSNIFVRCGFSTSYAVITTLIAGVFCLIYTYSGGLRAVLRTDMALLGASVLFVIYRSVSVTDIDVSVEKMCTVAVNEINHLRRYDLSPMSVLNYISATFGFTCIFFMSPDFWHRNVLLDYKSKNQRKITILTSMLGTIFVAFVAYAVAIVGRTPIDYQNLYSNNITKTYDIASTVDNVLSMKIFDLSVNGFSLKHVPVIFLMITSALTTMSSVSIASTAIAFNELMVDTHGKETAEYYYNLLQHSFKIILMILVISMMPNYKGGIYIALIVNSVQLILFMLMLAPFVIKRLPLPSYECSGNNLITDVILCFVIFIFYVFADFYFGNHNYFAFYSIVAVATYVILGKSLVKSVASRGVLQ